MKDQMPLSTYVVNEVKKLDLAYLHPVESDHYPFIKAGGTDAPIILAEGFTPAKAKSVVW